MRTDAKQNGSKVAYVTKDALRHDLERDYELADGKVVRIRRGSLSMFLAAGSLPNELRNLVVAMESGAHGRKMDTPEQVTEDDVLELERLTNWSISECLVNPKLTEQEVAELLDVGARKELFAYVLHGEVVAKLARFQHQLGLGMEGAGDRGGAGGS